jgi:hypothetical protein
MMRGTHTRLRCSCGEWFWLSIFDLIPTQCDHRKGGSDEAQAPAARPDARRLGNAGRRLRGLRSSLLLILRARARAFGFGRRPEPAPSGEGVRGDVEGSA